MGHPTYGQSLIFGRNFVPRPNTASHENRMGLYLDRFCHRHDIRRPMRIVSDQETDSNLTGLEEAPQAFASEPSAAAPDATQAAVMSILIALCCSHLLNDTIQALIPSIYPLLKKSYGLNFTQVGLITFTFQMNGSIFQPVIGLYTDRRPKPFSLAIGMGISLCGLVLLAIATSYTVVIV